jgi:hypothetical protein
MERPFYVNVARNRDWATVHSASCGVLRRMDGQNLRPPTWLGPYATAAEAMTSGKATGVAMVSACRRCKPFGE